MVELVAVVGGVERSAGCGAVGMRLAWQAGRSGGRGAGRRQESAGVGGCGPNSSLERTGLSARFVEVVEPAVGFLRGGSPA